MNLSAACIRLGDRLRALEALLAATSLRPGWADPWYYLARTTQELGDFNQSIVYWGNLIQLQPDNGSAHFHQGRAFQELGNHLAADACFDRARRCPKTALLCIDLGLQDLEQDRVEQAIEGLTAAVALDPAISAAPMNLGLALLRASCPADALLSFDRAIQIEPGLPEIHWNRALALLSMGDYQFGLAEYEWRMKCPAFASGIRKIHRPMWAGESLQGRTILIHDEQGFGDTIQFIRYVPLLARSGARVILLCKSPLVRFLKHLKSVALVITDGQPCPHVDYHCPIASLPFHFGTRLGTIPADLPYLEVDANFAADWKTKLAKTGSYHIGIVWSGNIRPDPRRSIPASLLAPLLAIPGVCLHSLQKRVGEPRENLPPAVHDYSDEIHDFADVAAIIANMDLVISIDTAAAHLSAAMGRKTFILLPFAADWRWLLDADFSPWYPAAKLFRQKQPGDWKSVIADVATESSAEIGITALRQGQFDDALPHLAQVVERHPDRFEAQNNLGIALAESGRLAEATAAFQRACTCRPDNAMAACNLGRVLAKQQRRDEAIQAFKAAIQADPNSVEAHCDLGVALVEAGLVDDGIKAFRASIHLKADFAAAHWFYAMALLLLGDFERGWPEYEWRWSAPQFTSPRRNFEKPQWRGEDIAGKTILLHCEQGFGDSIQFIRYIDAIADRGAIVLLEAPPELIRLFSGHRRITKVFPTGEPAPAFDLHCPLMTLPLIFNTSLSTIPNAVPYLRPDPDLVSCWRLRLGEKGDSLRVGIAWAGRSTFTGDKTRSLTLPMLAALGAVPGVHFFALQKGPAAAEADNPPAGMALTNLGKELADFADTAAVMSLMDLVISTDTSVPHLAGALGIPVWVMLQHIPDWRWLLGRTDNPWYPTMRLFRQESPGDWEHVVRRVATALADRCG